MISYTLSKKPAQPGRMQGDEQVHNNSSMCKFPFTVLFIIGKDVRMFSKEYLGQYALLMLILTTLLMLPEAIISV